MRKQQRWDRAPSKRSVLDTLLDKVLGELFPRNARPTGRRHGAPRAPAKSRRQDFALEPIEPRLLMSADLNYSGSAAKEFWVKAVDSTHVQLFTDATQTDAGYQATSAQTVDDGTITVHRGTTAQAGAASDIVHLDTDTFALLNPGSTEINTNPDGVKLEVTFTGGDQRLNQDQLKLDDSTATDLTQAGHAFGLSVTSDSKISATSAISVTGDLTLQSEATAESVTAAGEGLLSNADTGITLTGANLTASGKLTLTADSTISVGTLPGEADGSNTGDASNIADTASKDLLETYVGLGNLTGVALVTSFSHATIDIGGGSQLTATSGDLTITASVDGSITAKTNALVTPGALDVVAGSSDPEVLIHDAGTSLSAGGAINATATTNFSTIDVEAAGTTLVNSDPSVDGAVGVTVFSSGATLDVSNNATVDATGAAKLTASSTLPVITDGNASAKSAGAGVAVTVITGDTTATVDGATVDGSSVTLAATSSRNIASTATSALDGSSGGDASENTLSKNNAATSDGSVTIAGAVAVTVDTGTTKATVNDGSIDATGAASDKIGVVVIANPVDVVGSFADASGTNSSTGVGVAVAINVGDRTNEASLTGTTKLTTGGTNLPLVVAVSALNTQGGLDSTSLVGSSFTATATSGVSSSDTGVAGSLAINLVVTHNTAHIAETLTLTGSPNVTVEADTNIKDATKAAPSDGGGDGTKVGVGASVAFTYGEDTTAAYIDDGAAITGAHKLSLNANSKHSMSTSATNGAKATGGVAVTPVIAISVADDDAHATLGTGSLLTIGGDLSASSKLTDGVTTSATGNTTASSVGVGISIGLSIVNDSSLATTHRDLVAGGAAAFLSSAVSNSDTTAKASTKGGPSKSNSGGKTVDSQTTDQKTFAGTASSGEEAKAGDNNTKGTGNAASPKAQSSGTSVDVAGAVAVNIENGSSIAEIPAGISITASGGAASATSQANVDGHAITDGSATTSSGGIGVGVGVSINVINLTNQGDVSNTATVTADGLNVGATMADRQVSAPTSAPVVTLDSITDTNKLDFTNNGAGGSGDTITFHSGVVDDWTTHNFQPGQSITVTDAGANNGTYTIQSVSTTTLTLAQKNVLTTTSNVTSTVTAATASKDTIFIGLSTGLKTGDLVQYTALGGTAIGGLTDLGYYYINVGSDGTIKLYGDGTPLQGHEDAIAANSNFVKLTSVSSDALHELIKWNVDNGVLKGIDTSIGVLGAIGFNPSGSTSAPYITYDKQSSALGGCSRRGLFSNRIRFLLGSTRASRMVTKFSSIRGSMRSWYMTRIITRRAWRANWSAATMSAPPPTGRSGCTATVPATATANPTPRPPTTIICACYSPAVSARRCFSSTSTFPRSAARRTCSARSPSTRMAR